MLRHALVLAILAAAPLGAQAAGTAPTSTTPACEKDHAWSSQKRMCVKVEKSSGLSDDDIYASGAKLAYAGRYGEAVTLLHLAADENDPRILNYLGYATRKGGDVKAGLVFYRRAIAADPDYTLARSYMGEAFIQIGDRAAAEAQFDEIEARCTSICPERKAIADALAGKTAAPSDW